MALTSEQSNLIYKKVIDAILMGLDSGELLEYETSDIAQYVLENLKKVDSTLDLPRFYEDLASLWPFMDVLLDDVRAENLEKIEDEAAEGAIQLLKHGKVDDALDLVKNVTN